MAMNGERNGKVNKNRLELLMQKAGTGSCGESVGLSIEIVVHHQWFYLCR